MIFIVSRQTVGNPSILETRSVPRRLLTVGAPVYPRLSRGWKLFTRVVFEKAVPRYVLALAPFPIALILKPEWALALSQAPLFMFAVVLIVENYVFSISDPAKRKALVDPSTAAAGLDTLKARSRKALADLAAARGLTTGALQMVIEQSGLVRFPQLTMVSVQSEDAETGFVELSTEECEALATALFDDDLPEDLLQRINLAENQFVRVVPFDPGSLSAHARLSALAKA